MGGGRVAAGDTLPRCLRRRQFDRPSSAAAAATDPEATAYRQATVLRQQAESLARAADGASKGIDVANRIRSAVTTCRGVPDKGYKATATLAERWPAPLRELDTALAAACRIVEERASKSKLVDDSGWSALASSVSKTMSQALRSVPRYTEPEFRALLAGSASK